MSSPYFIAIVGAWGPLNRLCDYWFPIPKYADLKGESTCRRTIRSLGQSLQEWGAVLRGGPYMGVAMQAGIQYFVLRQSAFDSFYNAVDPATPLISAGVIADLWGCLLENLSYQHV